MDLSLSNIKAESDCPYKSLPLIVFAGNEAFWVNVDILKNVCDLDKLFTEGNLWKLEATVALDHYDTTTFKRFLEFAHKGFYTPPTPQVEEWYKDNQSNTAHKEEPRASSKADTEDEDSTTPIFTPASSTHSQSTELPKDPATTLSKPTFHHQQLRVPITRFGPFHHHGPHEDYSGIFLAHAQLYCFAKDHEIVSLQAFSLGELHYTLKIFRLWPERIGDVVGLIKYAWENTGSGDDEGEPDALKEMLVDYMKAEMKTLAGDPGFRVVLGEMKGDLLERFMDEVVGRVSDRDPREEEEMAALHGGSWAPR